MRSPIETLTPYVPAMVLQRLSAGPGDPEVARSEASVLFADISGFSKLTERLAAMGPTGLEELSGALNAYFDRLIEAIASHGGDVVKMAGDALIAVWVVPPGESLAASTLRASRCGLILQETLQNYQVAEGIRLSSKMGIGAGEVASMFVRGEQGRLEVLVTGPPLVQMGLAEKRARPGDVVLSAEAWALIREWSSGEPLDEGFVRLEQTRAIAPRALESTRPAPEREPEIQALVPAAIRDRIDAGQTAWLTELRRITVIFINLPPIDLNRPEAPERVRRIFSAIQSALDRCEGSLNKVSVDEKGTMVIAAMGLPPQSHRDDPRRGVRAARTIHQELKSIGVACSIGVATGRVYCGEVGNDRRREYTIIGRVVNLSARLMQAAREGQEVLCDEEVARACRDCFEFEALPPRSLKNIEGPVSIFRPIGSLDVVRVRRSTIGRCVEREALLGRLEAVRTGRGGVVVIEGEPGIGKSQLIAELIGLARKKGVAVLAGAGDAIERSSPYHAWRPAFDSLFESIEAPDDDARLDRILGQCCGDNPERRLLAPLLRVVLPLDLPESELTAAMTGQVRADNTNDLLTALLRGAAADQPTLLVIDDAHWLDSASWSLTLKVAQEVAGALLVVAMRSQTPGFDKEREELSQTANEVFRLGSLPDDEALALARNRLGVAELPPDVETLILQKAQGNPLYCEELSGALRDAGLLQIEGCHCRIAPGVDLASLGIPDTVEGIINDRFDRLSPSQQLALKVASVIGRLFAFRLLHDVYPIEPERDEVPGHLDILSRLELIAPERPDPDLAYIFRHVITRDVVYDLLPFSQRRRLHHAVATWYEQTLAGELEPFYPLLAYHWSMAGEDDRAIESASKAGEQALRSGAYREAVNFLDQAVATHARRHPDEEAERVARWEYQLGEAHLSLGHLVQSRRHAERTLELLGRPLPRRWGLPGAYLAQLSIQAMRKLWPPRGPRVPPADVEARRLASSAFGLLGQLCYFDQNLAIGVYSALKSLNEAECEDRSPELARSLAIMCIACGLVPAHGLAEGYGRRAFEVASGLDDLAVRAWVLQLTGMYDLGIGRWDRARASLDEAVAIARRLGDWRRWEESSGELARLDYYLGDFSASSSRFHEFGEEAARRDHDQAIAWSLHGRSKSLYRLGRFDEALDLLRQSQTLPDEALGAGDAILRGGLLALLHAERRDWEKAHAFADEVMGLIRRSPPMVSYSFEGYAGVVDTYLSLWESGVHPEARRSAWHSIGHLGQIARVYPMGRPRAWLCAARAHRLSGRRHRARWLLRSALRAAEALTMPYEQGLIHLEAAQQLDPADPARSVALARARSIFENLGALHLAARADGPAVPVG